jgi:AcrR family transcriptional regulator
MFSEHVHWNFMFSKHVNLDLLTGHGPKCDWDTNQPGGANVPKQPQTKEEHDAIRLRLIDAARDINNTEGSQAVTLRNVARRAGYSPAAMYRYFKNADDLVRSTWAETLVRLRAWLEQAVEGVREPLPRMRALLLAYGDFAEHNMTAFRTTFFLLIRKPAPGNAIYEDYLAQSPYSLLVEEVVAAMEAGAIAQDDPNMTAQTLWGFVHGVLSLDQTVGDFPFLDRRARLANAVELALTGLAAGAKAVRPARRGNLRLADG